MHRNKMLSAFVWVLLLSMIATVIPVAVSTPEEWDFPRLDNLNFVLAYPRSYAMEKARAGEIDNFVGAISPDDVRELTSDPYYWNISMNPGYHMCYIAPNCRPVTPESSGTYWNYHGRTPGFELYPLNISQFRMALEVIVAGFKDEWLAAQYEFINVRLDMCIPPANAYWHNPCIGNYPGDWSIAEDMLLGAGFTWDVGPDATPHTEDDIWICPNGMVLWNGTKTTWPKSDRYAGYVYSGPAGTTGDTTPVYGIFVMPPGDGLAPPSHEITAKHMRKWNLFFCGVEDAVPETAPQYYLFIDDATDSWDELILVPFYNRDHDMYFLCWGLGRDPDYLYDFFCSDVDIDGGDNTPGLKHDGLDRLLRTIKFWKAKDYEVLAMNVGPPCEETTVVPASTTFGPYGPFDSQVDVHVQVERVDLALGVYDEELVLDTDYEVAWTQDVTGKWWVEIHILSDVTLELGDALEAKFPTCTYHRLITETEEMRNLVYLAQWKLYYLVPYLTVYSRNYINLYRTIPTGVTPPEKEDWIEGWVEASGYGSEPSGSGTPWSFNNEHWMSTPVGGTMNWHDSGSVSTLNPITASWVYEINVLGRILEGGLLVNPYYQYDVPWIINTWDIDPWHDYTIGVTNGMILTFNIRHDVTWQDGDPVTIEDVAWNFEFLESLTPPEYYGIWEYLIKYETVGDYTIKLYVNATGLWKFYEFAGSILTFPQLAWEDYMGDYNSSTTADYTAATEYKPWEVPHPSPPSWAPELTMLYGTGPYYFTNWDPLVGKGVIYLKKNTEYWARKALQKSADAGYTGLLFGLSTEEASPRYYTFTFHNLLTTAEWSLNDVWISVKDCYPPFARPGEDVTIEPYGYWQVTVGPQEPKVTGDLGGGIPPRFFDYDGACNSKDYSLFLRALKKLSGDIIPEEFLVYIDGAIRFYK